VFIEQSAGGRDWTAIVGDLGPTIAGLIGLWLAFAGIVRPLRATRIENRIDQLETRLNNFYGPYYHLRKKSASLYVKLKQPYLNESDFSVLRKILSGFKFNGNDAVLIEEIIEIGVQCEELIAKNSGYIDKGNLRDDLLPRVSIHYRMLKLAYEGKVASEVTRLGDMTFPRGIDDVLHEAIKAIEDEKQLRENELNKLLATWIF